MAEQSTGPADSAACKIPGTHNLVDIEIDSRFHRARGDGDVILIPSPSADFDDPLNWSPKRKTLASVCWCAYVLSIGIASSNVYSILVPFSEERGISISTLNSGTGYIFLLAGYGLFFWQPFALQYGKRLTYIVSTLAVLAINVWSPHITSNGLWTARSLLTGLFTAPIEALPELSITDLYFTHERGRYMALYAMALVGGNFIAPIICGFINDGQGWQWVFYWPAAFCAATAVFLFLFLEETNYDRHHSQFIEPSTEDSKPTQSENCLQSWDSPTSNISPRKSYWQKLSIFDKARPFVFWQRLKQQALFLLSPIALYAGFAYGTTVIWFNVLNATASIVLGSAPYNFPPSIVGLSYIAPLIGVALGFMVNGRMSDAFVLHIARRNGGTMEPETRLWLFAISTLIIPCGLILWGVGSTEDIHWIGLTFAMAMLAFANTCGASLSVTYLVDCYRELSGDALTSVMVVRNTMSFGISYAITPWLGIGRKNAFISAACVGMTASLSFLIMIKWGKRLRAMTAERYWNLVRTSQEKNMLH